MRTDTSKLFSSGRALVGALVVVTIIALQAGCSTSSDAAAPTPTVPEVTIMTPQLFQISPANVAANTRIGNIAFTSSGFTDSLVFAFTGTDSDSFSVDATGAVTTVGSIAQLSFPVTLIVSASLNGIPLAFANLRIEDSSAPTNQAESLTFTPGQSFNLSNTTAGTVVGQVRFSRMPNTLMPVFSLTGSGSNNFAIDSAGNLTVATSFASTPQVFNLTLTATLPTSATTPQTMIEVTVATPASLTFTPGQSFNLSNTTAGTVVGQVMFSRTPNTLVPVFSLTGSGSNNFAIDSAGNLTVATSFASTPRVFNLTLTATLPNSATTSQTMIEVTVATPTVVDLTQSVFSSPQDLTIMDSVNFSEATAAGTCIALFSDAAPANNPCWALARINADFVRAGLQITYQLSSEDAMHYRVSGNQLLLITPPPLEETAGVFGGERRVRIMAQATGQSRSFEKEIVLNMLPPEIRYSATPVENVAVDVASKIVVEGIGFELFNAGPSRTLAYSLHDQFTTELFSIDTQGNLLYDTSVRSLVANQTYRIPVLASIQGLESLGTVQRVVSFTTAPPTLAFSRNQYDLLVSADQNLAFASLTALPATATPAQAVVEYEIVNDTGGYFFVTQGGNIALRKPLPTGASGASAELRAVAGSSMSSTSFTARVADIDFSAEPVDASVDRRNIQFTAMTPASITPTAYSWDFGDDSAGLTDESPMYSFSSTGTFTVSLTATTAGGDTHTVTHKVYAHSGEDPYQQMQWHLSQPARSPFLLTISPDSMPSALDRLVYTSSAYLPRDDSSSPVGEPHVLATAGEDIRALDHLMVCGVLDTCRGEGVVVLVADSGAQITHPDLIANTRRGLSRNLIPGTPDLFNPYTAPIAAVNTTDDEAMRQILVDSNAGPSHATAVAGIILADAANDIGVVGVAPKAELASYNFLDAGSNTFTVMQVLSADYDVGNHSWNSSGVNKEYTTTSSTSVEALEQVSTTGRGGRGSVNIKSAGNEGAGTLEGPQVYPNEFGNFHNAGLDGHNTLRQVLTVAGVRASGEENISSEAGANILLSAYWALPCQYQPRDTTFSGLSSPVGIVSTDLTGDLGKSWGSVAPLFISANPPTANSFLGDIHQEDGFPGFLSSLVSPATVTATDLPNHNDYEYCFNGTSGAAPQVSGAVALMLQARPELTWRDVRAILARSARQNDASDSRWASNGGGLSYHPNFGFGVLDTTAAVNSAKAWSLLSAETSYTATPTPATFAVNDCSSDCGRAVSNTGTATQGSVVVSGQLSNIETVEIDVNITFVSASGGGSESLRGSIEIALEHRNAAGQLLSRSVLQKRHPYYETANLGGGSVPVPATGNFDFSWKYLSLNQFGEDSAGTWSLVVTDFLDDDATITVDEWQLIFHGYN